MIKLIITILFLSVSFCAGAQRITVEQYIEQYKDIAISEMKRSGVPASITLAQGILETESGNSDLVKNSNNHFGIKCKSNWVGESVYHDDDASGECFRAYAKAEDSYRDHSDFLRTGKRYGFLFNIDVTDYAGWARGLKKAGYATNPRYPDILIKNIEQYNLQQYTLAGINDMPDIETANTPVDRTNKLQEEVRVDNMISSNDNSLSSAVTERIILVNNSKCVFAKKGTSLLAIANKHNITLNKLMDYNDLTVEGILDKDQYIYLQKKSKTGNNEYYIVQPGETIYDVAQKNGIQLRYLRDYNNLIYDEDLSENAKLFLQPGIKSAENNPEQFKNKIHIVAPREGLYAIARKYNVTVQQLKEWNHLDTNDLKTGQEIIVSK